MNLFFAILLSGLSAQAFTLNNNSNSNARGWPEKEVVFRINPANCPAGFDLRGVIGAALDVWNGVPNARLKVSVGDDTTATGLASHNPPVIFCEPNFQAVTGADAGFVPGGAIANYSGDDIAGAVVVLNAQAGANANVANYDSEKLKIILAHELGHALGLGHSGIQSALMYYDASLKNELSLHQDDMDGISYLYPRDEIGGDGMYGCGMIAAVPPSGPWNGFTLFLFLPLWLYFLLRFTPYRKPSMASWPRL